MSAFIPIPKKGNGKECSNYCTIAFISQAIEVNISKAHGIVLNIASVYVLNMINTQSRTRDGSRIAEAWLGEF